MPTSAIAFDVGLFANASDPSNAFSGIGGERETGYLFQFSITESAESPPTAMEEGSPEGV